MEGGNGTRAEISLYDNPDWAKGFDVVVHNECFADTTNQVYLRKITAAHHAGVPAVVIHCAMHTYRSAEIDDWREFLGVTSKRHDHQSKYPVMLVEPTHPILKGMTPDWVTTMDELYVIDKLWPNAKALATSVSERDRMAKRIRWRGSINTAKRASSAPRTVTRTTSPAQRRRVGHIALVEIDVLLGEIRRVHHGPGLAEVEIDVQLELLRRSGGKSSLNVAFVG
jgi:hypothetical protein